jgi:hypothetical protein
MHFFYMYRKSTSVYNSVNKLAVHYKTSTGVTSTYDMTIKYIPNYNIIRDIIIYTLMIDVVSNLQMCDFYFDINV